MTRSTRSATQSLRLAAVALLVCAAGCRGESRATHAPPAAAPPASVLPTAGATAGAETPPRVMAPLWTLPDLFGQPVSLASFRGRVVLLNFWATWCPPCREEIPDLVRLDAAYRARDVVIIGVAVDAGSSRAVQSFADGYGMTYPIVLGSIPVAQRYRVAGIPASFLLDRQGRVVKRWDGPYPLESFASSIEAALAEEAP